MGRWSCIRNALLATTVATAAARGEIRFVDAVAPPGGDGLSWATAYRFLQDAIAEAGSVDVTEIRIAQGTYMPDDSETLPGATGDPAASFLFTSQTDGLAVRGGYAGLTTPDPGARDIDAYPTILSGDLVAHHVVRCSGVEGLVLDGVTIKRGFAFGPCCSEDRGGGMYAGSSTLTVIDSTIKENAASNVAGGVWMSGCDITFVRCFIENNATPGNSGAAFQDVFGSNLTLIDCVLRDHHLGTNSTGGGAIFVGGNPLGYPVSSVTAIGSEFISNNGSAGGAVLNNGFGTFDNCLFIENDALGNGYGNKTGHGGAIANIGQVTIANCTFFGNSAADSGGGLYTARDSGNSNLDSIMTVSNSILWDNGGQSEADQIDVSNSTLDISYSCVEGLTGQLGGTGNIDADPGFVDPGNGDLRLSPDSPCIDAADNTAVPQDITTDLDGLPRFLDVPEIPDTGNGDLPVVDMGAYESVGGGCLALLSQEIVCQDTDTFAYSAEGLNACTGGTTQVTFTGSGGAPGEEMCFTVLVNDGGFCCSTQICVTVPDCTPPGEGECPADLNGDGAVGIDDFLAVLGAWNTPAGDVNGDGTTDILDFLVLLGAWGSC